MVQSVIGFGNVISGIISPSYEGFEVEHQFMGCVITSRQEGREEEEKKMKKTESKEEKGTKEEEESKKGIARASE